MGMSLRVLLIRKDFKLVRQVSIFSNSLRVLLIRKDFKRRSYRLRTMCSLRVLLIRKDFKLFGDASISGSGLRVLLIRKDFKQNLLQKKIRSRFESLVNTEGF